ncbi:MAG: DNA glycosylase [Dialister sp.]|nr:DNA glycosylase [Dialister sp.]
MKIYITDDFDPDKIIDSGQCFRPNRLDDGRYRFITGRNILHIFPLSSGTWQADCTPYAWKDIWYPYFDLKTDYKKLRAKIPENDLFLKKAAAYGNGIRILRQNPFEMLITFIISQRKSIPAIRSAVEKLCRVAGTPVRTETEELYLFPSPSRLSRLSLETLRDCSLGYRAPMSGRQQEWWPVEK